ncbi:MAG: hypothetical protein O8C55_01330 [Candidatus Methanoperedens sp.]|nr:hypothetical protein [Candidatus Methanoperedens sp.]
MSIKIGKTQINIEVQGCYRCGTLWSSGWHPLKEVPVQINGRSLSLTLNVCHDCATPTERATAQASLPGE